MTEHAASAALTAADEWTPWLQFRGAGAHKFAVAIWGTYTGALTHQMRRPALPAIDDETFGSGAELVREGEFSGSFDVRVGFKAGETVTGTANVEVTR